MRANPKASVELSFFSKQAIVISEMSLHTVFTHKLSQASGYECVCSFLRRNSEWQVTQ